jgi:hypothetical protein
MSFREYIARRRITKTPAGDFTEDARSDDRLPDATSWEELEAYLRERRACHEIVEAARQVWNGYGKRRQKLTVRE